MPPHGKEGPVLLSLLPSASCEPAPTPRCSVVATEPREAPLLRPMSALFTSVLQTPLPRVMRSAPPECSAYRQQPEPRAGPPPLCRFNPHVAVLSRAEDKTSALRYSAVSSTARAPNPPESARQLPVTLQRDMAESSRLDPLFSSPAAADTLRPQPVGGTLQAGYEPLCRAPVDTRLPSHHRPARGSQPTMALCLSILKAN